MKRCLHIAIYFTAMLFLACCGNSENNSHNATAENGSDRESTATAVDCFTVYNTSVAFPIDTINRRTSPQLTIEISLPVACGESRRCELINNAISYAAFNIDTTDIYKAAERFVEACKEEYYDMHPDYINEKGTNSYPAWFNFSYTINGKISHERNGVICCTMNNSEYTGGAHGMEYTIYLNIDSISGHELKLNDIFVDGCEEALCSHITTALMRKLKVQSISEVKEKGYLTMNDMFITDNFKLESDSIIFHYNRYEIAPYCMGNTRIALGYNEIKDLLIKQ